MKHVIWKRRIAVLLTVCMLATQMVVPVFAQNSAISEEAETVEKLDIPSEYKTLEIGKSADVVDVAASSQEESVQTEEATENEVEKSLATYGSIPVVGTLATSSEEEPKPVLEESKKMDGLSEDVEEVVSYKSETVEGELTLGVNQMAHITIAGEAKSYTFTPEKSGRYILSTWTEGKSIGVSVIFSVYDSENGVWNSWNTYYDNQATIIDLVAGGNYKFTVNAYDQGYVYMCLSEAVTISGNTAQIGQAAIYEVEPDLDVVDYVQLSVSSRNGESYYVTTAGGVSDKDGRNFWCSMYMTHVIIWKKNAMSDTITISESRTPMPVITAGENQTSLQQTVEIKSSNAYFKFIPSVTGTYVFGLQSPDESPDWWRMDGLYEIKENSLEHMVFSGQMNAPYQGYFEAGKEYVLFFVGGDRTYELFLEKEEVVSGTYGTKTSVSASGRKCAQLTFPAIEEAGVYEVQIEGASSDVMFFMSGDNGDMGTTLYSTEKAYKDNRGVRSVFLSPCTKSLSMMIYTENFQKNLGNLTVSVTPKDGLVTITPDEDNCGKLETTLTTADTRWVSFVPNMSGDYVLATDKKYGNVYTETRCYELTDEGALSGGESTSWSYDNIHVIKHLEAGTTYYYKITQSNGDVVQSEKADIIIYPVQNVDYSGTGSVETEIRKSVVYTLNAEKAGFYKLNINGADESYLLTIDSANEDVSVVNSFVYKDIPRIFQFTRPGTYEITVSKEIMSDSKDTITFSCTTEGALQLLKDGEYMEIPLENMDGTWIEYTPQESGWYTFEVYENEDEDFYCYAMLSVLSEDKKEILNQDNYGTSGDGSEKYYTYYLEKDRIYYYHIYPGEDALGTTKVRMNSKAQTIEANDTDIPEISVTGTDKLVFLRTNFTEKQYVKFDEKGSAAVMNVTEGYNSYYEGIEEDTILVLPEGEQEYLFYFYGTGDRSLTMKKWQPDYSMTASQKFELTQEKPVQWAKFEPQKTGFYSVALTDRLGDASVSVTTYELLDNCIGYKSYLDSKSRTAYLEEGQTYFLCVEADDDIMDGETTEATLNLTEAESDEVLSEGDYTIAMNQAYIAKLDVEFDTYYQIITDPDLKEGYRFNYFSLDKNGKVGKRKTFPLSGGVKNITFPSSYQSKGKNLYILITKSYTEEKEEFAFGFHKAEIIEKELTVGQTFSQPASNAIKYYKFTPTESGNYSIIMSSNDENGYKMPDYMYIECEIGGELDVYADVDGYYNDLVTGYKYQSIYHGPWVYLNAGREYYVVCKDTFAYDIKVGKVNQKYIYDYDKFNAFFASGGTISLKDELTEDMRDDVNDGYADYIHVNNSYIYMDASTFENQNAIWFPHYYETFRAEPDTVSYATIAACCEGQWGDGFIPKVWYKVDSSNFSKSTKVNLSQKIGSENILLAYREPETVYIQEIKLSGVTAMTVGQTAKITATTSTLNKYAPTNPKVTFTSSDSSVVSVDAGGNMTAKGAGSATITCKSADGNAQATLKVTVKQNIVRAASVTITGAKDIYVEDEIDLKATIGTNGKGKPTVDGVNWSSSDPSVATVDASGHVVGIAPGTVKITAASKDGYAKQSVEITVKPILAKKVTLNETTIRMKKGSKYTWLEATIKPANTTNQSLTWKSSNSKVATVSKKGVITAKAVGTATITVKTSNGKTDKVKVTVTASNIKVKSIKVPKKETLIAGEVLSLKPEVDPVNATNSKVSYKSSNEDVATVTKAGVVTAKKPGKATITVTAKDGTGKKATCTITVKAPDEPKKPAVKSNKKKTATLTWGEVEKADGYVIYMSTSKKGKYKVAATIKKGSTTEYTIKKLKSKKKYYFKVVSYVNVGKKKVYSDESKVINVKVK